MINKIVSISTLFFSILFLSCVDDDVCDKPTTSRITFSFKYETGTSGDNVDSLIIVRVNPDDSLYKTGSFYNPDTVRLPMNVTSNTSVFYLYRGEKTEDNKDVITINHNTQQVFVSKECGFKVNYSSMIYKLTEPTKKIKSIIPITTEITNNEEENLSITY